MKRGRQENLTPFKPGHSGNPNGRPKKIPAIDELLADVLGEEKEGKTAAQAILMALRAKATKGDVRAAEVLLDRAYGKPKQEIQHSGEIAPSPAAKTQDREEILKSVVERLDAIDKEKTE